MKSCGKSSLEVLASLFFGIFFRVWTAGASDVGFVIFASVSDAFRPQAMVPLALSLRP